MRPISVSATFQLPLENLFHYVADPEHDPEWCDAVLTTQRLEGEPEHVGARYDFTERFRGQVAKGTIEVTEVAVPTRIAFRVETPLRDYDVRYDLEDLGHRTRLTQTSTPRFHGALRYVSWTFRPMIRRQMEKQFSTLANHLLRAGQSAA